MVTQHPQFWPSSIVVKRWDVSKSNLAWIGFGPDIGLGPGYIALDGIQLPSPKGSQRPPILAHICCSQTVGWIKMKLGMEGGIGPGHTMLHGDRAPCPERGTAPDYWPISIYSQTAGWIKMPCTWYGGRPNSRQRRHCVRWRSSYLLKGKQHPQFSAHVYCGQTARWTNMPVATEVDLGPGHIVLDGNHPPPERGPAAPFLFSAHVYCGQTVAHLSYC